MDKQIQILVVLVLIRFLVFGGFADVIALGIALSVAILNNYMNRKPVEISGDLEAIKTEVESLKSQVSSLNLAQGIKKLGGSQ